MKQIMIVDDSATARMFLIRCLQAAYPEDDLVFIEAENGQHAFDILRQSSTYPQLIISDQNMPIMTGLELIKKIQASPKLYGIPIIIITSSANPDLTKEFSTAGVHAILEKPITPSKLRDQLLLLETFHINQQINQNQNGSNVW